MNNKPGYGHVLLIALILLTVTVVLTTSLFGRTVNFLSFGSRGIAGEQANSLAEAGLEKALWQLNQTAGAYTGESGTTLGSTGTFTVMVENKSSNIKTITATGFVPNSIKPTSKRTIKVDVGVDNQIISFNYAVQIGTGGITMSNSSRIVGTAYSNKTGVSIQGSNSSRIEGDAFAVGTISSPDPIVTGTKHQNQAASVFPTLDYNFWENAAEAGGTISCGCNYSGIGTTTLGSRKLVGNLTVSNSRVLDLTGPLWVTGDLVISNSGKIRLNNSFGSNGTVIVVNGKVSISNTGGLDPTTANPKGYILVASTYNGDDALTLSNQGANAIFYALEGGAIMSNTAQLTELVAERLQMSNSASLIYDSGLASSQFSTGPGGSWQLIKGSYKYDD